MEKVEGVTRFHSHCLATMFPIMQLETGYIDGKGTDAFGEHTAAFLPVQVTVGKVLTFRTTNKKLNMLVSSCTCKN